MGVFDYAAGSGLAPGYTRPSTKEIMALNEKTNEVVRSCHVCLKPTKNLDYSICEECREAILFMKEFKKVVQNIHVESSKM